MANEVVEVRGVQISKKESRRLLIDWWGKCWTCKHWAGDMSGTDDIAQYAVLRMAPCTNPESALHAEVTSTGGYCEKWDPWDDTTALELLFEWDEAKAKGVLPLGE